MTTDAPAGPSEGRDTPPASPNPLGGAAATEDQVGLAVHGLLVGFSTAVALLALVAWGTARIAATSKITSVEQLSPDAPQVNLAVYGALFAIFAAAVNAWRVMAPIRSNYRRGGLAMVAGLGGGAIGGILTFLCHALGGPVALLALVPLGLAGATYWSRRAQHAAR